MNGVQPNNRIVILFYFHTPNEPSKEMWGRFTLTEVEEGIFVVESDIAYLEKKGARCLVGWIIVEK
jgi:uncharacterized protein YndB with AHSA1/START domain